MPSISFIYRACFLKNSHSLGVRYCYASVWGLFDRAILRSGGALAPWAVRSQNTDLNSLLLIRWCGCGDLFDSSPDGGLQKVKQCMKVPPPSFVIHHKYLWLEMCRKFIFLERVYRSNEGDLANNRQSGLALHNHRKETASTCEYLKCFRSICSSHVSWKWHFAISELQPSISGAYVFHTSGRFVSPGREHCAHVSLRAHDQQRAHAFNGGSDDGRMRCLCHLVALSR